MNKKELNEAKKSGRIIPSRLKAVAFYLGILAVVSIILAGVGFGSKNSMVIYAQQLDKPDFIQVFFPIDGVYSEENSERSAVVTNPKNGIKINFPRTPINRVRVDPANSATRVLISKIELRYLFNTVTYMPNDLVIYSKPVQMIDELEITTDGLVVHSTGNDPVFELELNRPSLFSRLIKLSLISVILSLVVFLAVMILKSERFRLLVIPLKVYLLAVPSRVYLLLIPLFVSLIIAAIFYPGAMSYDTLHALHGARNEVTDSMWPPMVSYVWRVVDFVSLNPSAMHFSQLSLLLFSVFFIVYFCTKNIVYAAIFLIVYISIPVILGTMAVIWKDVLMAAFFMSGLAVTMCLRTVTNRWLFKGLLLLALSLIFLGVCSRHNAITGAIPLVFYLSWVVCLRWLKQPRYLFLGMALLGSVFTGSIFFAKTLLDTYSLPSFNKMPSSTSVFIESVRVLDVAGASLCVGENLFVDVAPYLSLEDIRNIYDPKHANLSKGLVDRSDVYIGINERWLDVALHHPICFFYNKVQLTKYLVGANLNGQFLLTHNIINNNEYGYVFQESVLRDAAFFYIKVASRLPVLQPWFIYLLSIIAFIYMFRVKKLTAGYFAIYMSAIFYFASFVAFGNAADARLLFYTTTALSITVFISAIEFKIRR